MFSIGRARKLGTPSFRPTHLTDQPLRAGLSSPGTGYGGYGGYWHLPRWDHEDLPAFPTFSQRSPNLQDLLNGVEFSVRSWWFLFGTMEWTHVKGTCSEQVGFRSLCQIAPNSCWSIWSIQKASCNRGIQSSLWQRPPTATTPSQASWPRHATTFQHITGTTGATGGPKALWASYSTHGTTKPRRSNCPSRACHGSNSMPVHCLSRGKSNVGNQACGGNWHAQIFCCWNLPFGWWNCIRPSIVSVFPFLRFDLSTGCMVGVCWLKSIENRLDPMSPRLAKHPICWEVSADGKSRHTGRQPTRPQCWSGWGFPRECRAWRMHTSSQPSWSFHGWNFDEPSISEISLGKLRFIRPVTCNDSGPSPVATFHGASEPEA